MDRRKADVLLMEKLEYNKRIGQRVFEMTQAGVSVRDIFGAIQTYQDAPKSMTTFYRLYRQDMDNAKGEVVEKIGNKIVQQALEGDFKSQELYLRSKGGWSPSETQKHGDEESEMEEAESALEALERLLGRK